MKIKNLLKPRIEFWPIARPRPSPQNARIHSEEQISQIAKSLDAFGQVKPIICDESDEILAGHGTLEAANQRGWKKIAVLVKYGLSLEQKRAYRIADNQIALNSAWDFDLLKLEVKELKLADFDLELTGFSDAELDELLKTTIARRSTSKTTAIEKSKDHHVKCPQCGHRFPVE